MASPDDLFSNGNCLVCGHSSTVHSPPYIPLNSATSYTVRAICSTDQANAQTDWENAMTTWKQQYAQWQKQNPKPSPSNLPPPQPTLYTLCEKVFTVAQPPAQP